MEPKATDPSTVETVAESLSAVTGAGEDEGRFLPGTLLGGRYRILTLLGRGGMGEVYRAMDLTLGQSVALKFLPEEASRNQRLLERFHGEVRVARLVSHPNVCRVYDIGAIEGMPFISMEYVDGEDLASLLTRIGRLPADKAVETARKLCAGLGAAHDRGVIHRDLKPANIMMNKRGEVVIMDFGLAAIAGEIGGAEARNGTPAYMSPEQIKGAGVTSKSDIYALGLVLYELFTGKRPFDAQSLQQLVDQQEAAQLSSMTSIAADIDPAVEKVIRRCLDPDPAKRPSTALTVLGALPGGDPLAAALAAGETPSPEMVAAAGKVEGMPRRYSVPCLALVVLFLAAHFDAIFSYPGNVHVSFHSTQFGKGPFEVSERFFGTRGASQSPYSGALGIAGEEAWTWAGSDQPRDASFSASGSFSDNLAEADAEKQKSFIGSITSGQFHNQAAQGVESALTAMLGRRAAYTGREVTWDELLRSNEHWDAKIDIEKMV